MEKVINIAIRSYRDLRVWQQSKKLCISIYQATASFPDSEKYGLTNQMRRAAVSVPSNIAEGNARSTKEFIRFIDIALGSVAELETQVEIAIALNYLAEVEGNELLQEAQHITNMLGKLSFSLKQKNANHKSQVTDHNV